MTAKTSHSISALYNRYRIIVLGLLVVLAIYFLWPYLQNVRLQYFDFNVFWNAAYHTLQRTDPYEADWFLYPPWVIPLFLPLGLLPFEISRLLWYLVGVALILILSDKLWAFYQGPPRYRWLAWIIGITFSPAILALIWGQLSPLVLLGVFLFLKFCEQSRNDDRFLFWAGLNTYWMALKPQLLFIFWPAWFLWLIRKRAWRAMLASLIGVIGVTLLESLFVPDIFFSYLKSFSQRPPAFFGTPTLGYWLRLLFGEERFWLQFIPPIFGLTWLVYHWIRKKDSWRWNAELPLLVFASLITTPHGWTHDYLVLLPGILQGFSLISKHRAPSRMILFILLWIAFNAGVIISHFRLSDFWFYWQIPVLLWFTLATTRSAQTS